MNSQEIVRRIECQLPKDHSLKVSKIHGDASLLQSEIFKLNFNRQTTGNIFCDSKR